MDLRIFLCRPEDESADDLLRNNGLLTTSSGAVDDRHTRHITRDDRLLPALALRRRFDQIGNTFKKFKSDYLFINFSLVKKDKRSEGGNITIHDDSVLALISNAAEERLKDLIEQMKTIARQRIYISCQRAAEHSEEVRENFKISRIINYYISNIDAR